MSPRSKTERELTKLGIEWPEIIHGDGGQKPTFFYFLGQHVLVVRRDNRWVTEWQGIKVTSRIPDEALAARRMVMSLMGRFLELRTEEKLKYTLWIAHRPRHVEFEDVPLWREESYAVQSNG